MSVFPYFLQIFLSAAIDKSNKRTIFAVEKNRNYPTNSTNMKYLRIIRSIRRVIFVFNSASFGLYEEPNEDVKRYYYDLSQKMNDRNKIYSDFGKVNSYCLTSFNKLANGQ